MGILSYGYKASKSPAGKKIVETVKNIFKGGKQKTTGTEVVQPFTFKPAKNELEKVRKEFKIDAIKSKGKTNKIIQQMESEIEPFRRKLRRTTQKIDNQPVTESGFNKGKDLKAKGGRVGLKSGTNPFARKSNIKKIQETFGPKQAKKKEKPKKRMMAKDGSKKKKKKFPDLTGDGKVTFADVLKGRGVINGKKKKTKKKFI
jgi:hypothetical protein